MSDFRLPTTIRPIKYHIHIEPNGPDYNRFNGKCKIKYYSSSGSNNIILNSVDLMINSVKLFDQRKSYQCLGIIHDEIKQQIILTFDQIPTEGTIEIEYVGQIYTNAIGIFKAKQWDEWVIYTHFEPIYARRAFPCFDEPKMKATFSIEIVAPKNKSVISNSSIKEVINMHGKKIHVFNETPPMSTYIVAFYIGNTPKSEGKIGDVIVRVFSTRPRKFREEILNNAIQCIGIMTDYFNLKYPLGNLDLVYVPKFEAAAMENWGLIILKEPVNKNRNDEADWYEPALEKINTIYVVYHELAHQWFGNVVTIDWWTEIWLNESFATWFGWHIMQLLHPEWKPDEQFYVEDILEAFEMDYLKNTHAVISHIDISADIPKIFNTISYIKGSTIINMLVSYIGKDTFMKGIQYYINKYKYSTATTNDFIESINLFSKKPITKAISKWLNQKNYPVVNINLIGNDTFILSQECFSLVENNNTSTLWDIPLTHDILMSKEVETFNLNKFKDKINKNAFGFYLVNYHPKILSKLINNGFSTLSNIDIADIINNLFMMLRSRKISFDIYLNFLHMIINKLDSNNPSGIIVELLKRHFMYFKMTVTNQSIIDMYVKVLTPYAKAVIEKLELKFDLSDSIDVSNSRINVFELLCLMETPEYVNYTTEKIKRYMDPDYVISDNYLTSFILRTAMMYGDQNVANHFHDYTMSMLEMNKMINFTVSTVVYTIDPTKYQTALELIFSDKLEINHKLELIQNAGQNEKMNIYLWSFIEENWDYIEEIFSHTQRYLVYVIDSNDMIVDDDSSISENMRRFIKELPLVSEIKKALFKTMEHIEYNTNFREQMQKPIR